jgi:hypothetical protein
MMPPPAATTVRSTWVLPVAVVALLAGSFALVPILLPGVAAGILVGYVAQRRTNHLGLTLLLAAAAFFVWAGVVAVSVSPAHVEMPPAVPQPTSF